MSILEVTDLHKSFPRRDRHFWQRRTYNPIIKGISFNMAEGEILGILGPNGAGKTTTLQMLLGILTPTSGTVKIFNQNIATHKSSILEKVNFSSTYVDLPWRLTVAENLTWSSHLYAIADRPKRLAQIKELFRLEKLWRQPIAELSAGQKTRVNLARSMINYPKLLLLDEPTASLDPEVAAYIREFFADQRARFHTSIILTSHNMAEVEELCDRVLILQDGLIIGNDTPANLAKKIDGTRLNLRITKNSHLLAQLLRLRRLIATEKEGITTIQIPENKLPLFLYELTKKNIQYSEISIDKPTLQDYFLHVAKRGSDL